MEHVNPKRFAHSLLPAAVFFVDVAWVRYGAVVTVLAVIGGLAVAAYAAGGGGAPRSQPPRNLPGQSED